MKLKLHEIIALNYELNGIKRQFNDGSSEIISRGLLKQKVNMKTKLYLQRLNNAIADDIKIHDDAKKELINKYSTYDENGSPSMTKENVELFNSEYEELLTAEKDVNVQNLWSNELTIDNIAYIETDEVYPIFLKLIDNK